jgi:hypothetical protein
MLHGTNIKSFIHNHEDIHDFMLRVKVPRSSKLFLIVDGVKHEQQNTCRYYMSRKGGSLMKVMPSLEDDNGELRQFRIADGYSVKVCNNMNDFDGDIDVRYYVDEARKLVVG